MPGPLLIGGAILAGANAIGRWFKGRNQKKIADKINPVFNQYQASPYAGKKMGLAKQLFAGRMFGAPSMERNIFSNQANYQGAVERSATDSSSAISAAASGQGQTDQSITNLMTEEKQNKYQMLENLNDAYGGLIEEGDKEYDSMRYKYEQDVAQKNALRESGESNQYGAVSDVASLGIQLSGLPGRTGTRRVGGIKPIPQNQRITERTTINTPQVGTGRPSPAFRPMSAGNFVRRRPQLNLMYNG